MSLFFQIQLKSKNQTYFFIIILALSYENLQLVYSFEPINSSVSELRQRCSDSIIFQADTVVCDIQYIFCISSSFCCNYQENFHEMGFYFIGINKKINNKTSATKSHFSESINELFQGNK